MTYCLCGHKRLDHRAAEKCSHAACGCRAFRVDANTWRGR